MGRYESAQNFYYEVDALTDWNFMSEFHGLEGTGRRQYGSMTFGISRYHDFGIKYYNSNFVLVVHNQEYMDAMNKEDALAYIRSQVKSAVDELSVGEIRNAILFSVQNLSGKQLVNLMGQMYGEDASTSPVWTDRDNVKVASWIADRVKVDAKAKLEDV